MLVLTRAKGEKIICGEQLVTITVLELSPKFVKLGIDAPRELPVHREEIYDRIKAGGKKEPVKVIEIREESEVRIIQGVLRLDYE